MFLISPIRSLNDNALFYSLVTNRRFIDDLLGQHTFTLLDAGAKGGVISLGELDPYTNAYGFEPDPVEFERLKTEEYSNKKFLSLKYFNQALGEEEKHMEFYMAGNSSYNSVLPPDLENYEKHLGMVDSFGNWKRNICTKKIIDVQATTLDLFTKRENIPDIDHLKLDTQGSELEVLNGAGELLASKAISMIRTEVSFVRVYKNQCLYGDLDLFLRENHFTFVDCIFYPEGIPAEPVFGLGGIKERGRYSLGGDAIYIIDLEQISADNRTERAIKVAIQLAQSGYLSLSKSILEKYSGFSEMAILQVLKYFNKKPFSYRASALVNSLCPPLIKAFLKKLHY